MFSLPVSPAEFNVFKKAFLHLYFDYIYTKEYNLYIKIGEIVVKRRALVLTVVSAILLLTSLFSGCQAIQSLLNKTPENFTEGIKYSKDYEEDILEIYDGAVVYAELTAFGENILFCGTKDDFDDIADFYKEFFEKNEITLSEETEGRDEYYARGFFDGYEFKLKISEPEGEYVEDLFEYVIALMTRELKDGAMEAATPVPSQDTAATPTPTPAPQETPQATQALQQRPPGDAYETRLSSFSPGTWSFNHYADSQYSWFDWTIYIYDEYTGVMFYSSISDAEYWREEFTYTIEDGVLSLSLGNGDAYIFYAYVDYDSLHLVPYNDFSINYYLNYYGEADTSGSFDAFGDWMIYYPYDGFIGTFSFWPDGTGYIYNCDDDENDIFFTWENNDGTITYWDEAGYEIDSFSFVLRHDILEVYSVYYPEDPLFYNRTAINLLSGSYTLNQSNDPGLYTWELDINSDYSAYSSIQNGDGHFEDSDSYWYIDYYDYGRIYFFINGKYYYYDYHHYESGLLLWDSDNEYYYELTLINQ